MAYRFIYTALSCHYKFIITISKTGDSSNLHILVLQDGWSKDIGAVVNEYDKKITQNDWQDFSELMKKADFWGLRSYNYELEGHYIASIIATGLERGNTTYRTTTKYNYVYRRNNSTLDAPFKFVYKLSGNTYGCL